MKLSRSSSPEIKNLEERLVSDILSKAGNLLTSTFSFISSYVLWYWACKWEDITKFAGHYDYDHFLERYEFFLRYPPEFMEIGLCLATGAAVVSGVLYWKEFQRPLSIKKTIEKLIDTDNKEK